MGIEEEITLKEENMQEEPFYVVGIGASAGGLEALQNFFKAMTSNIGAAFVVVQHLSPDHKSLMDELLSRCTTMIVKAAQDGQKVMPNHVYLIPPGKDLSIYQGKLYLQGQNSKNHINLAIDSFFRSLAADKGKYAIAVVLSTLRTTTGIDFSAYKENTIIRRLERRISVKRFSSLDEY